jgi:CDGSH-type Zn-finger protein
MSETTPTPHIFATRCERLELEPGIYSYCTCGHSQTGTFCDGSHRGKGFVPMTFTVEEKGQVALCLCKHTQTPPFCDGSHKPLRDAASGNAAPAPEG